MTTHPSILIVLFNQHSAERASYVYDQIPTNYNSPALFIESEAIPPSTTNGLFADLQRLEEGDTISLKADKRYIIPSQHVLTSAKSVFKVEKRDENHDDDSLIHIVSTLHAVNSVKKITVLLCNNLSEAKWKTFELLKSNKKQTLETIIAALISTDDSLDWITSRLSQKHLDTVLTQEQADTFFYAEYLTNRKYEESLELQLEERIKEQRTLYQISQLYEQTLSETDLLKRAAQILKSGFIDPLVTEIQIVSSNATGETDEFSDQDKKGTSSHVSNSHYQGYPILIKARLFNPDLKIIPEETHLMQGVANILALKISRLDSQQKLKKAEERSRLFLSNISDIITICDEEGIVSYQSPSLQEILGYEPDFQLNKSIYTLIHPDDHESVAQVFLETLKNEGTGPRVSFRAQHKNGHYVYLKAQGNNQLNNSAVQSVIISSRDITEEKKHEQQLKESAAQYKYLFNNSPIAKFVIDAESFNILDVNEMAVLQYQYSKKEFRKLHYPSLHASDSDIDYKLGKFLSTQSQGEVDELDTNLGVFRHKTKKSGWIYSEVTVHPIMYQNRPAMMIACMDVSEREQTMMRLRDREKKLTQAQRIAKLGYWELSLITQRYIWSDEVYEIWNKKRSEFIPTVSYLNRAIHPEDLNRYQEHKLTAIKDRSSIDIKFRVILDDTTEKWLHHRAQPVYGPLDNHPIAYEGTTQDITEFEQTQKQLRTDEARLLAIVKSQTNYVIRTDMEGNYTYANDKFLNEYGWLYEDEDIIGKSGMSSILEEDHVKTNEVVFACINEPGKVFQTELRKPGRNGTIRTTFWDFICITDQNGKPTEIQAVGIDISDLKHAQKEMEKAYEEKNEILESIEDGFFATDDDFTITYWNHSATEILGVSREEIIGSNLFDVFPAEADNNYKKHYINTLTNQNPAQFEEYYAPLNQWFDINAYPKKNGIAVYFKDITERKHYEEKLKEANERFEIVLDASSDAIWELNLVTGEHMWGKGFFKLFGYNIETLKTSPEYWQENIHPEDRERVVAKFNSSLRNPEVNSLQYEYRFKKADGTWSDVVENGRIIRNEKNEAIRVLGTMQDITAQKEFERSLQNLNTQLEKSVQELADSNKDLEHFAYVASHDLQEPLRMITGFLEQLKQKYGDQLDENAQTYIRFAVDGARRMRQLILDLLDFSRVSRQEFEREEIDLNNVLAEIKQDLQSRIESNSAIITSDELPTIYGHRGYIQRLIQNLLSNALKYRKADVTPEISIKAEESDDHWTLSVNDNGIGFNMKNADKIFVIFQRLHNRDSYSGTGLGLAIAKKIAELHGGNIWVESKPGKGSTFYFTIKKRGILEG